MRVFLSHAEVEKPLAVALAQLLASCRPPPEVHLTDYSGPRAAEDWRAWLRTTIPRSDVVVLLATELARGSLWVAYELGLAFGAEKAPAIPRIEVLHFSDQARDAVPEVIADRQAVRGMSARQMECWLTGLALAAPPGAVERFCAEAVQFTKSIDVRTAARALVALQALGVLRALSPSARAALEAAIALGTPAEDTLAPLVGPLAELSRLAFATRETRPESDALEEWLSWYALPAIVRHRALQLRVRLPADSDSDLRIFVQALRLRVDVLLRRAGPAFARAGFCVGLLPTETLFTFQVEAPPPTVLVAASTEVRRLSEAMAGAVLEHLGAPPAGALAAPLLPLPFARLDAELAWELPSKGKRLRLTRMGAEHTWELALPTLDGWRNWNSTAEDLRLPGPGRYHWEILNHVGRPVAEGVLDRPIEAEPVAGWGPSGRELTDWVRLARAGIRGPHVAWLGFELDRTYAVARDILGRKLYHFGALGDARSELRRLEGPQ